MAIGFSQPLRFTSYKFRYIEPMDAATISRTARQRAGLTQVELARRCGIAQPALSNIESGGRDTRVGKLNQILDAVGASLVVAPFSVPTVAEWAPRLAWLVEHDAGGIHNALVQISDDLSSLGPCERIAACVTPPQLTGVGPVDALLAALVEHRLAAESLPVPAWVDDPERCAPEPWDLITRPALVAIARRITPEAFSRRNVYVPEDLFQSV